MEVTAGLSEYVAALEEAGSQTASNNTAEVGNSRPNDVKLPEFWPHAPVLWFSRAECMLTLCHVEDEVIKYCSVVTSLPHNVQREVVDLLDISQLSSRTSS
jgi:hypothetical protein